MSMDIQINDRFTLRHVIRTEAGERTNVVKLRCPACGVFADMDSDQYHGRVSVECECGGFHETHNFAQLEAASLKE
jgi:hypothetical protein